MKKILNIKTYTLAAAFMLFGGCNNDLNLVEGWKDIPVVNGLLSISDTATYIKVEKAFVDPSKSAYDVAQIPDSLYYSNINVVLVRKKDNERFVMTRVDGALEGYPRDSGIFARVPNYLYKVKNNVLNMRADEEWAIEVYKQGQTRPFAQALTQVVGNYDIYSLSNTAPAFLTLDNSMTIGFDAIDNEVSGKIFDVNVNFIYDDVDVAANTRTRRKAVWQFVSGERRKVASNGTPDPQISFRRPSKEFYQFLGNNIPVVPGVAREFVEMEIEVFAGSASLAAFQTLNLANSGITGSQNIPYYTNIKDATNTKEGGLGLFASRNRVIKRGIKLNDQSINLLKTSEFTSSLRFR